MNFEVKFHIHVFIICSLYVWTTHSALNINQKLRKMRQEEATRRRIERILLETLNVTKRTTTMRPRPTWSTKTPLITDDARSGTDYYSQKQRVIQHSEKDGNSTRNVILFKLTEGLDSEDTDITRASLVIRVMHCGKGKKWRNKKRTIRLAAYNYNLPKVPGEKRKLSEKKHGIQRTQKLDLPIPVSVIHRALKSPDRTLALRIRCKGCSKGIKLILPHSRSFRRRRRLCRRRKRKKSKTRRKRLKRVQKRHFRAQIPDDTPMLIIHTLKKFQRVG